MGYLNVNCLRNKIIDFREIVLEFSLDYHVQEKQKSTKAFLRRNFT